MPIFRMPVVLHSNYPHANCPLANSPNVNCPSTLQNNCGQYIAKDAVFIYVVKWTILINIDRGNFLPILDEIT